MKGKILTKISNFKSSSIYVKVLFSIIILNLFTLLLTIFTKIPSFDFAYDVKGLNNQKLIQSYENYRIETIIEKKMDSMSFDEKIGQLFLLSIPSGYLDSGSEKLLKEKSPGGIILMSNNIISRDGLKELITDLQENSKTPLLIATDQEGGSVARIIWDEARYISQPHIGIVNRDDFAYETALSHANALDELDISMNLAPVLDVSQTSSSAIHTRSFGKDYSHSSSLGRSMIKAYNEERIISTAKHFPGLGRSATDSHTATPILDISREELLRTDLLPFKAAIDENVPVIMTNHVIYSEIDSENPASLSKVLISDLLRDELEFSGVVITDDIHMSSLNAYPDKIIDAILAGNDMILIVDSQANQISFINQLIEAVESGTISEERINDSVHRILRLKVEFELL